MRKSDMRKRIIATMKRLKVKAHMWGMTPPDEKLAVSVLCGVEKITVVFPHGITQLDMNRRLKDVEEFVNGFRNVQQGRGLSADKRRAGDSPRGNEDAQQRAVGADKS